MCERQYPMEDDQASIQPSRPKTIFPQDSSTRCIILGTALPEGIGRREMVWTGTAMMIRGVEKSRDNTGTLLIFKIPEVLRISYTNTYKELLRYNSSCVDVAQTSWECLAITIPLSLHFILACELFHIYTGLF